MAIKLLAYEITKMIDNDTTFFYELADGDYSFNSLLEEVETLIKNKVGRKKDH